MFFNFESLKIRYRILFSDKAFLVSLFGSLVFLVLAAIATVFAKDFVSQTAGEPLGDLILDRIPDLYLYGVMVWGTLAIAASILVFNFFQPEHFPAFLKSVGLL